MIRKEQGIHFFSLLIIALVICVYSFSMAAVTQTSLIDLQSGIVYRGKARGIAFECAVRWDSSYLEQIVEELNKRDISITFFVTPEWTKNCQQELKDIAQNHEIGLLGETDDILDEIEIMRESGIEPMLYMPYNNNDAEKMTMQAKRVGMRIVLSSVDILNDTTDSTELVRRFKKAGFDGSIIRFEPTAVMMQNLPAVLDSFETAGLSICTVGSLIDEKV